MGVHHPLLPVRNSSAPKYLITSSHQSSAVRNVDMKYPCHKIPSTSVTSFEHAYIPRKACKETCFVRRRSMTTMTFFLCTSGGRGGTHLPGWPAVLVALRT
ncbi:hypothetical protein M405DRAFT_26971 [Rhizopogon salebrosus TDB-379]|nr:hypothetical protein M405DRAFT_26971 [Rhizopogon salebrosus TDB-379]